MLDSEELETRRPLGLTLLTGLYLFFFLVSVSTYGNPFPFLGTIYQGSPARILVFVDSLVCVYLFLGLCKRQRLTWYLLIAYNLFEITNTIVNLTCITAKELEQVTGTVVRPEALFNSNIAASLALLLLTQFIFRAKEQFSNRHLYLF